MTSDVRVIIPRNRRHALIYRARTPPPMSLVTTTTTTTITDNNNNDGDTGRHRDRFLSISFSLSLLGSFSEREEYHRKTELKLRNLS